MTDTTRTEHPVTERPARERVFGHVWGMLDPLSDSDSVRTLLDAMDAEARAQAQAQTAAAVEALLGEGPDSFLARTMQDAWEAVAPVHYHEFVRERIRELLNDSTASARFIADVEKRAEERTHRRWIVWVNAHGLERYLGDEPSLLATTPSAEGK